MKQESLKAVGSACRLAHDTDIRKQRWRVTARSVKTRGWHTHTCETRYFSKRVNSSTINLWHAVNTKVGRNIWFYHHRKSSEDISRPTVVFQFKSCFQFWLFHFQLRKKKSASFSTVLHTWHPVPWLIPTFLNLFLTRTIPGLFLSQATSFCTQCLILN